MTVSYESAMQTLTSMFASVDKEVVAMILQANGGHMENSVEHLLALSGGGGAAAAAPPQQQHQQAPPARAPPPARPHQPYAQPVPPQQYAQPPQPHQQMQYAQPVYSPGYNSPAYGVPVAYPARPGYPGAVPPPQQLQQPQQPQQQRAPAPKPAAPAVNSLYQIPDDFLRPPSYFIGLVGPPPAHLEAAPSPAAAPSMSDARVAEQIEQDHLMAQMLMDEEFMADLAAHPERYQSAPAPQGSRPAQTQQQQQQQAQSSQPRLSAPPAHPHPDFAGRERTASMGGHERMPSSGAAAAAAAPTSPVMPSSFGSAASASSHAAAGSEPLHPHLRHLEAAPSGGSGPSRADQQSSFASKWASLTAGAREKLARLSERFKKDALHDRDLDGGGDYGLMDMDGAGGAAAGRNKRYAGGAAPIQMHDIRIDSSSSDDFLSKEEAERLQAGYGVQAPAASSGSGHKKKSAKRGNAFTVDDGDADPFGAGANGSGDEGEDELAGRPRLGRPPSASRIGGAGPPLPLARNISSGAPDSDEYDEDEAGSYQPPRLGGGILSPSRVMSSSNSSGYAPAASDVRSPVGARKRSTAEQQQQAGASKDKTMPLLQDM